MNNGFRSKRFLRYGGIALGIAVLLYVVWVVSKGWGTSSICAGVILVLFAAAMLYFRQLDVKADDNIARRIRAEYSSETQPQVFEIYNHLKTKELEYLFLKVLDDAKGNLNEVKKLAALAESMGWKAFLDNRW